MVVDAGLISDGIEPGIEAHDQRVLFAGGTELVGDIEASRTVGTGVSADFLAVEVDHSIEFEEGEDEVNLS